MRELHAMENIQEVLTGKRLVPTVTLWNRLEGRPRTHDFDRALKAEIRDPLWMLTKQWQMGEFQGDDAGSPIKAKVHVETTQLDKYRPGLGEGAVMPFPRDLPLEAVVEQRPLPLASGQQKQGYDLRVLLGRRWLRLVADIEPGLREKFIAAYPITRPDPEAAGQVGITATRAAWSQIAALAGRAMDGHALYAHLTADSNHHSHDEIALDDPDSAAALEALEAGFIAWFRQLILQPGADEASAWRPSQLEYQFEVSAPRAGEEQHLVADEYFHGHLDWYNLDQAPDSAGLPGVEPPPPSPATDIEASHTRSFVPVPIRFEGMPHTRWWSFEDGTTNFGDITADTTDINKLLLMEFALVFANDWFLMPFTVPAGTIAKVKGVAVTNTFGERTWIEPTGSGQDDDWQRWTMYSLSVRGHEPRPADLSLVVVPSVPKIQQSEPLEVVHLIRDEVANLVWGIETVVAAPSGAPMSGRRAALDTRKALTRIAEAQFPAPPAAPLIENEAAIRYQLMTKVPENWIPFIPVHVDASRREVQLRRAAMPRVIEGTTFPVEKIRPRTQLLRPGLDPTPTSSYELHEEEVPRSGVQISQSYQRTRWYDGRIVTWFGARKTTGRGERSSGLGFDRIQPLRRPPATDSDG
jgi:hypothetical protein